MKDKRTKAAYDNSNQIPKSLWQAVFCIFWPLNSWLKKGAFMVLVIFAVVFTIWIYLPERSKNEVIDYLKGRKIMQSPTTITLGNPSSANVQKDIEQHTEGDQSPSVISGGDVSITIGDKQKK